MIESEGNILKLTERQLNDLKRISELRVKLFGVPDECVADPENVEFLLDNAINSYLGQLEIFEVTIEIEQYNSMCE
ncbi:hypothetical protein P9027_30445 [Bacillus thuringiensis]|uniref:hypothetical protein n=1 Tax=Bacillus thuringiensis TaxID=1428 RepID=UPI002DB5D968|nr:hypothetical protein [Bacillus thuringiensis]MEC3226237.1 hypothetical protein [Bacillus thuringiensis]MEC3463088.1 hypothetical protein [Bacillus thuringiensis]MEC3541125.1 hypothetical protein [Bacillus thuringiensis]MEC3553992.1 hypothetical protein [Bacillus thuringiensis]MED2060892.1 hypothetical protein [Bacillus thuringiensis]